MSNVTVTQTVDMQIRGHVIAYDLSCETRNAYREEEADVTKEKERKSKAKSAVAACRVACTQRLHKLGLESTQSVILCPTKTTREQIREVQEYARSRYDSVNVTLRELGFRPLPSPDIRAIPIVTTQFIEFKSLAEKKIISELDALKDERLEENRNLSKIPADKKPDVKDNLTQRLKRIEKNQQLAKDLGINLDDRFSVVIELFKSAIEKVS